MLGYDAWITLIVLAVVLVLLVRGRLPTDAILFGATVLLAATNVINVDEFIALPANEALVTIAALFVVAAAMRETGAIDRISRLMFGRARTELGFMMRLAPQTAILSAFLNNTAVVAMFQRLILDWCRRHGIAPSRLLMPLSYFAIMGGTCTLIGTSTNLVVGDLFHQAALAEVRFWEFAWVGVPFVLVGTLYVATVGRWLLPRRADLLQNIRESAREYLVEMRVGSDCTLIGKRVEEAGLRQLPGLFLVEIERNGRLIAPVRPDEMLLEQDRLTFTGIVESVVELERIPGLRPAELNLPENPQRRYCEAVVSYTSPLIGRTIRGANFRALYNAVVLAVHRSGERLSGRVGDIVLQPGDTLLLQTGPNFAAAHRNDADFYLVSGLEDARPVRHTRAWISFLALAALIWAMVSRQVPVPVAALLVAGTLIATRCISSSDARRSIQWNILLTLVGAFGLGKALENTHLARYAAEAVVSVTADYGPTATLAAVYFIAVILTELLTNAAAAVIVFPLAISAARALEVEPLPFGFAVAFAASSAFSTPIGYQTHMMVFGPGRYRYTDFVKIGVPLTILLGLIAIFLIPLIWPFHLPAPG